MRFIPVALLLAGCAPQSATLLSGEYFAFLSDTTSFSLAKGTVDPEDWPAKDMWTVDCRAFESKADREAQQLPGALDICDTWLDIDDDEVGDYPPDETWMGQTPWWILHENLDPWRGEAIITSEGDFQVGFHHTLPGGEDFRFAFVIDPDFAPKQCDYETGKAVERDGNWLENWSKDLKGMKQSSFDHMEPYKDTGTLYYLNSTGFQINPKDTQDFWFIPEQWEAGYAAGKFAEESFSSRYPLWGTNELYEFFDTFDPSEGYFTGPDVSELYFCELEEGEDPFQNGCYQNNEERLSDTAKAIREDYADAQVDFQPLVHNNAWRPSDGADSGFDGWHELHYGWVVVDGKIDVGNSVSGAFTILLQANDSNSRFLVKGEFEVPKIKKDRWVTEDIRANKLEENGNTLCVLE